jgi:hypothetical protein
MQREFGGRIFDHISSIVPERGSDGAISTYTPHHRYEGRSAILHKYGAGPFCRFRGPAISTSPGVYVITVNDKPTYVGECEDLQTRFETGYGNISPRNCFIGGQSTNCKINHLILEGARANAQIDLWFRPGLDRKRLEFDLIAEIRPAWNGKSGSQTTATAGIAGEYLIQRESSSKVDQRSRPPGPHADQILNVLSGDSNLCDDCLSAKTRIQPRQQVNQLCRKLRSKNLIRRFLGGCDGCGGIKTVNSRHDK